MLGRIRANRTFCINPKHGIRSILTTGGKQRRLLFDATMIANTPFEVCVDREGEGGVLLSCGMSQSEVDLPFANISFEEAPAGN